MRHSATWRHLAAALTVTAIVAVADAAPGGPPPGMGGTGGGGHGPQMGGGPQQGPQQGGMQQGQQGGMQQGQQGGAEQGGQHRGPPPGGHHRGPPPQGGGDEGDGAAAEDATGDEALGDETDAEDRDEERRRPPRHRRPRQGGDEGGEGCDRGEGGQGGEGEGAEGEEGADAEQRAAGRDRRRRGPDPRKLAHLLARAADADDSRDVSSEEMDAFLAALGADESGAIDVDALIALLPPPPEDRPAIDAERLARDLDHDGDGAAEVEDVQWFLSLLDRDDDGALAEEETKPPRPLRGKARGAALALTRAADADESRDVTAEEWEAFLASLVVDGDGAVSLDDLASKLPPPRHRGGGSEDGGDEDTTRRDAGLVRAFDRDGDGVVEVADLQAVFDQLDGNADGALDRRETRKR